jgi:hypothetical protein
MTRQILLFTILTLGLSCVSGRQEYQIEYKVGEYDIIQQSFVNPDKTQGKSKKNIRFDFSASRINTYKETIEIKASLFNDNTDTVYFLSSSCDGAQYSLHYDRTKFVLTPFLNCNVNYPILIKIAPKGQYNFQAHFRCSSKETKIKLGFDFYPVDKSFDLNKISLAGVHGRQEKEQSIIWTDVKTIE